MEAKYNPDMPTYWQASSGNKAEYWFEAINKEIDSLIKHNTWKVMLKSDIGKKIPLDKIISTMRTLKKKRNPDKTFKKYKGHFYVCGDLQRKHTNVDSFAPVVSWTMIRLILADILEG
eukprot:8714757-Ditylum_brightwellii.AAC.1